jgi:uncharacterized protein YbcI
MQKSKAELEQQISRCMAEFLSEQLGERARSVAAFLSGDTLTVRASHCLAPGERLLVRDVQSWQLFQEFKNQQYEKVKPQLQERLEQITASKVLDIISVLGQNGMRFDIITLNKHFDS